MEFLTSSFSLAVALVVVAVAVALMARRVEVRLVLLGGGLLMSLAAGKPLAILDAFADGMVASLVAPICAAMGFAAVLSATRCDRHLVGLLTAPLRRVPWLVVPGSIVVAFVVNIAIPSQAAAAAAVGPILIALMLGAGVRPAVAGAALLLGASFGGDLLNPGDQNVQAVVAATGVSATDLTSRLLLAGGTGLAAAAIVFALLNRRGSSSSPPSTATKSGPEALTGTEAESRPNPFKAAVPLVPVVLLMLGSLGAAPVGWLMEVSESGLGGSLPVVRAMLIGTLVAALVSWRELPQLTSRLFEGMGSGYAKIISMIITAQCFGAGLNALGVCETVLNLLREVPGGTALFSVGFPWGLAVLSGSGSGPIFTFADAFLRHAGPGENVELLGALTCLAGSVGRTMSPVAPVVIYCSGLVGVPPLAVVRVVLPALLVGAALSFGLLWWLG